MFLIETVFCSGIIGPGMFSVLYLRNAMNMRQYIFVILINFLKAHTDVSFD